MFCSNPTLEFCLLRLPPLPLRRGSEEAEWSGGGDSGRTTLGFSSSVRVLEPTETVGPDRGGGVHGGGGRMMRGRRRPLRAR